jgi:uncharacterized protein YbbC (DUF1343 family)
MAKVASGLEVLVEMPELVGRRQWALLANHAAVTPDLRPARAVLREAVTGPLIRLFAPEHGLDGVAQDMEAVGDGHDPITGLEVRSLYGRDAASLAPAITDLQSTDVLVVDLPDVGARHYTFAATMDSAMAACERAAVEVLVLDRPNPIGGLQREGGLVRPGFQSFVSQLPTPARHGLTVGEIALLLQRERYPNLALTVVPCRAWRRTDWWDETGLPWVPPSPNMPNLDTATLYPGLCLVEATNLSEGRGTTRPFHLVGAPWVDAERLTATLVSRNICGLGVRSARFRPQFQKHAGTVCSGVELHVTDRSTLEPVALGLALLRAFQEQNPERFCWRTDPYEFVTDIPALDLLTGSAAARELLESGADFEPLLQGWRKEVVVFEESLDDILLYRDV